MVSPMQQGIIVVPKFQVAKPVSEKTPEDLFSVFFFVEKDLKDEIFSLSKGS